MLAFPQLSTTATAQFPNARAQRYRTSMVEMQGGTVYRLGDPGWAAKVWTLQLSGLSSAERAQIEALFAGAEGRLRTFVFLDPNDNLLRYSSDFAQGVWVKQTGLVLSTGQTDPAGGNQATSVTNPTNTPLQMYQVIGAPGSYQYCLSVYVKTLVGGPAQLVLGPSGALAQTPVAVSGAWNRVSMAEKSNAVSESVLAGIEVPPLSEIVVYGAQLEAAISMSAYGETSGSSGMHARCRFVEDEIRWVTDGPDEHSVQLAIVTVK